MNRRQRIAVIAARPINDEKGGAERFYEGLVSALNDAGVSAELINVLTDESNFEAIEETYLRCYDLDVSAYDGVISTKAPTYLVQHPNHLSYLVHTMRVFYDMFDLEFPDATEAQIRNRQLIHTLDTGALSVPRVRKVFSIGNEVSQRLFKWNSIESEILHPALVTQSFKTGAYKYLFMPGRLHRWKRIDLIIKAFQFVKHEVQLKIAGTGEDEARFRAIALNDPRIEFLGRVTDEELVNLYADALAVPFVPIREDYGFITLEAFSSAKPVITCKDSGEPTCFVKDGISGFVCSPDPEEIAKAIDYLVENRDEARMMGYRGKASISHISWPIISSKLLKTLIESQP